MKNSDILNQTKDKIEQINSSNPTSLLEEVKYIVAKLNTHICGNEILEQKDIKKLCQQLTRFTTLPAIPLEKGLWVGRARKIKDRNNYYTDVSKLSYIPKNSDITAPIGRMNRYNQSMFYCSFGGKISNDNLINTILSEVNAKTGEAYYMLTSQFTDTVRCAPIGAFDYYRRGVPHPFGLHSSLEEVYKTYKKDTQKDGMFALELCDAFLTNILKTNNSDTDNRLYEVTSEIADDCMNSSMDGLIYPSVKLEGYPNIVLSPDVVDKKLSHKFVYDYEVTDEVGYGMYKFEEKVIASIIEENNYIAWPDETYQLGNGTTISYSHGNRR